MKNLFFPPIAFFIYSMAFPLDPPMPDPSAVYCKFLGYKLEVRKDVKGEYGVCIFPDGSECDSWHFYRGQCGKEFSYCAKKGCETLSISENRGSYSIQYCACQCTDSLGNKKTIPLLQYMEQNGDTLIKPSLRTGLKY